MLLVEVLLWESQLKENLKKFLDKNFDLFATAIETATVANNDLEKNIKGDIQMKGLCKKVITLLLVAIVMFAMALPVFADIEGTDAAGGTTRSVEQDVMEISEEPATEAATEEESENLLSGNKALAAGLAITFAAGLGALGMGIATGKAAEGISRQPEAEGKIRTTFMLGLVFIETAIIYALLTVILIIFGI